MGNVVDVKHTWFEVDVVNLQIRIWRGPLRQPRERIRISQHDHLLFMRDVPAHEAPIDHIRHETLCLFHRYILASHSQRRVEQ
jgi:hypothetical protein